MSFILLALLVSQGISLGEDEDDDENEKEEQDEDNDFEEEQHEDNDFEGSAPDLRNLRRRVQVCAFL